MRPPSSRTLRALAAAGTFALAALPATALPAAAQEAAMKMLTIVTSPDAETQAMALVLSNQVAGKGGTVEVLLCGPGGDIAQAEAPAAATETITPTGMTVRSLLEALMDKGATVNVCAIYLPNRDLQQDALMDGVGVAKPPVIADAMMDPDTKIFGF